MTYQYDAVVEYVGNKEKVEGIDNPFVYVNHTRRYLGLDFNPNKNNLNSILLFHPDFKEKCRSLSLNGRKIVIIGDSVIYGWKLNQNKTVVSILNRYSKENGLNVSFISLAMPGYNLDQVFEIIKEEVYACNPSLIIYGYFQNDISEQEIGYDYRYNRTLIKAKIETIPFPFKGRAGLARLRTYLFFEKMTYTLLLNLGIEMHPKQTVSDTVMINKVYGYISEKKVPFVVVNLPFLDETYRKYNISDTLLAPFNVLEFREYLLNNNVSATDIRNDNIHLNEKGHKLVADYLLEYLLDNKFI